MEGGAELGRGFNGVVMDVHSTDKSDKKTLVALLEAAPSDAPWVVYTAGRGGKGVTVRDGERKQQILEGLKERAPDYVAKTARTRLIKSTKTIFKKEIGASAAILAAYGPRNAAKHLAMGAVPVTKELELLGLVVPKSNVYAMFNRRCNATLDKKPVLNDADFKQMVVQVLASLAILGRRKWLHTDLKPDNVIYCEKSKRYKLIDFGGAIEYSSVKKLDSNLALQTVIRTRSPMMWYIAGANASTAVAMSTAVIAVLYKSQWFGKSPLARAVTAMTRGFSARVEAMLEEAGGDSDAVRCKMAESMLSCVDTVSLGLALVSIIMREDARRKAGAAAGLSIPARNRAMTFVHERMLDMSHPRFAGHDLRKLAKLAKKELA